MKKTLLKIGLIFVLIILFLLLFSELNNYDIMKGKLYISEILASNTVILEDNNHEYSDYIEIYNGYNRNINLSGYHLSDSEYDTNKWTFPDIEIKAKEYLIIYASGKDDCDINKRICHTNFKLSKDGEVLTLTDKVGNIISKITFKEQFPDISYGYQDGKYIYMESPSPGQKNNSKEFITSSKEKYQIEITEYMTHNKNSNYDKYGNYYDWMEIYNSSDKDYILEGIYVSDDINKLTKSRLPNVTLKSHEYLVIYFTGTKVNYEEGIYLNFSLTDNDKYLIVSNGKKIIDKVELVLLENNISYGKTDKGWKYFPKSTPGRENDTSSFDKIGDNNGSS